MQNGTALSAEQMQKRSFSFLKSAWKLTVVFTINNSCCGAAFVAMAADTNRQALASKWVTRRGVDCVLLTQALWYAIPWHGSGLASAVWQCGAVVQFVSLYDTFRSQTFPITACSSRGNGKQGRGSLRWRRWGEQESSQKGSFRSSQLGRLAVLKLLKGRIEKMQSQSSRHATSVT